VRSSSAIFSRSKFQTVQSEDVLIGGGVMFISDSQVVITDCNFSFIQSSKNGGVIHAVQSNLTMENCRMANLTASGDGGAIFLNSMLQTYIAFSSICNSSSLGSGGGIYLGGLSYENILSSLELNGNIAIVAGGGIFVDEQCLSTISQSNFASNSAHFGGAMYSRSSNLTLSEDTYKFNTACQGGAIYVDRLPKQGLTLTFMYNSAKFKSLEEIRLCQNLEGAGGAIFVEEISSSSFFSSSFSNWLFVGNFAEQFGGAFAFAEVETESNLTSLLNSESFYFDSNQAVYGSNIGTTWNKFNITVLSLPVLYLRDSFSFEALFFDSFGQNASGDSCQINLAMNSEPAGFFKFFESSMRLSNQVREIVSTPIVLENGLTSPPNPTTIVLANISVELLGSSFQPLTNLLELRVCDWGQILQVSYDQNYGRFQCIDCLEGTYADYSGQVSEYAQCKECKAGYYSSTKAWKCAPCVAGTYSAAPRSYMCPNCSLGSFMGDSGSTSCRSCPSNTFSNIRGQTQCMQCPFNSINFKNGSSSVFDCVCPQGFYGSPWRDQECKVCPKAPGVSCEGNNTVPFAREGFYRSIEDQDVIQECLPQLACREIGQSLVNNCSEGYFGIRCGNCMKGYYRVVTRACVKCPNRVISAIVFFSFISLFLLWFGRKMYLSLPPSRMDLKVVILWIQIVAVFSRLSTNWPPLVQALLNILSAFVRVCLFAILTHVSEL
jgi:hypothetical protein